MLRLVLSFLFTLCFLLNGFSQVTKQTTPSTAGPVRNLEAVPDENDRVFLTWDFPEEVSKDKMTISWSSMVIEDWAGVLGIEGTCQWDIAQRFDTMDIRNLSEWRVEAITCVIPVEDPDSPFSNEEFYIRVWQGTPENPAMCCNQLIENLTPGELQTVYLNEVVMIEEGEDLFIGLNGNVKSTFPWAYDFSIMAPDWKGCLHKEYFLTSEGNCEPYEHWSSAPVNLCISATLVSPESDRIGRTGRENQLTGYRIYRNGTLIKEIPYPFMTYFTDNHFAKELDVTYCVTAMYGEEESEPLCTTTTVTGIQADETLQQPFIHPNPTTGTIYVDGAEAAEIQVYNTLGQQVGSFRNTNEAALEGLPKGIYQVRIIDRNGKTYLNKVVKQ